MYLYARLQKGECFGCLRGAQLFSVRSDAKPARHCKALGKPLQEDRVSLPVKGPDPTATKHPFLWAVRSSRRACSVSQQGFFFRSSSLSLAWWAGGKTALGFARHRLRWSINERCSPPPAVFGRVPRWEGWHHTGHGERCYVRGL